MSEAREYLDLSEESKLEQLRHAETLTQYETQRRARSIVVPTAVDDIKARLRQLGHPITLFGEDHADRRERLRSMLARIDLGLDEDSAASAAAAAANESLQQQQQQPGKQHKEVFYSPACEQLIALRRAVAEQSFARAHQRLQSLQRLRQGDDEAAVAAQMRDDQRAADLYGHCEDVILSLSQLGDERPLSAVRYSPDGAFLSTGSFAPVVKLWEATGLACVGSLRGHTERITSTSWKPTSSSSGNSSSARLLASSSADGSCMLWDCRSLLTTTSDHNGNDFNEVGSDNNGNGTGMDVDVDGEVVGTGTTVRLRESLPESLPLRPVRTLKGHSSAVASCCFHPYLDTVATASHDFSWRLWDIETGAELLLQDGHIKECSGIAFHPDGSLAMSTDSGGVAMLWDLRSGHMIQGFQGHIKKITGVDFHPVNGFQVATCSLDNTVKIWDLRKRKCSYTLPAHSNVLTDVKFSSSGELLLTSSFDTTCKLWCGRDFHLLRCLTGHSGKVMAADFAPDEKHIVSAGYDRTLKLWANKNEF
jgi:U4/U6 small nuclear ribonucleoprotein PRP4